MSKKARQRKLHVKHPPGALSQNTAPFAPATTKPWQIAVVCIVLAMVTLFAFRGVRANGFVTYDDPDYVSENQQVQQGVSLHGIEWAFTTFRQGNWHPLTWISHMVDWNIYGNNPSGHHLTNVCLHAANAVLLFLLLLYMTGFLGRSAIVACLFALHPAHVESVAWIAERKDVLCAFFFLCALLAYAWYLRKPSWKRYAWIICAFACALMSKPMAVTFPFTLLLLDYWPLRRITFAPEARAQWLSSLRKLCVEKWPLFIMSAASSVITVIAQRSVGAVAPLQGLPLWVRISNAAISCWRYVRIMVWPDPLIAFYYHERNNINVLAALVSIIALILLTAVCWRFRKQKPYCLVGWLWFLGTLAPVIGIVQVGDQAMAERYTYIPFIGLFITVVWLVGDAVADSPKLRVAAQLLAVAVLVACAVKTNAQVKVWKDSVILFSHVLDVDSRGLFPNSSLGMAYFRAGKIAEAQPYLERALTYAPDDILTLAYSAMCLMQTNDQRNLQLAGQRLDFALRIAPGDPDVLTVMALRANMMGNPKDAESDSRKVIAASPDSVTLITARLALSDALQAQNKFDEATQQNRQVLAIEPDNYQAHYNLGMIDGDQGLAEEAMKEFRLSLAIKPDQALPHFKIGSILLESHQLPAAIEEFNQALQIDPANADVHNNLGVALVQMGQYEKAIEQFTDAVRIEPDYAGAKRNIDLARAHMNFDEAKKRNK